jgi:AAA15 family ATPase/GTPase
MVNKDAYVNDRFSLQQRIKGFFIQDDPNIEKYIERAKLDSVAEHIIHILNISYKEVLVLILRKKMQAEFNMQINNLYHAESVSEITLRIMDAEVKIRVKNNEDIEVSDIIYPDTEVIYIDDPNALDNLNLLNLSNSSHHRSRLISYLSETRRTVSVEGAFDEIITLKKLDAVLEKLNSACSGKMERKTNGDLAYMENGSAGSALVDIVNVSTGLKTFVIIKKLLLNGSLVENGTLILDEPEIHLHPEWQLILAELIVLIQKEFNMHILINTHSPYFLDAIEVYSRKHDISNKCKYYLAESSDAMSVITDVSDNIELIYEKLARPLQDLENERYSDD